MSEELSIIQPKQEVTALAALLESAGSTWGDETQPIRPRYLRIRNPKTETLAEYPEGVFVDKDSGETWTSMPIVILMGVFGRRFQSKYKKGEQRKLWCRSNNRQTPVANDDRFTPKASDCESCAYGQKAWSGFKESGIKPDNPCELEAGLLFITKDNPDQPYILTQTHKNGRSEIETIYNKLSEHSKRVARQTGRRPWIFEFVVTMDMQQVGDNYYPKFRKDVEVLTPQAALETFGTAYQKYVLAYKDALDAAQRSAAAEGTADDGSSEPAVETPAQEVTKPSVNANFVPSASRRAAAGTKPVYTPPTEDSGPASEGTVIEAKAEIISSSESVVPPSQPNIAAI